MRHGSGVILIAFLLGGPALAGSEPDDGVDVYFREAGLLELSKQELEKYVATEAGESELLDRAFPGAPPQISHTLEDMLPITSADNSCLDCHHPENAVAEEDLPLPDSHFERAVMGKGKTGEGLVWVVRDYEKAKDVVGTRYDCMMCHVPQTTNVKALPSRFVQEKTPAE